MAERKLSVWMTPALEAVVAGRDDPLAQRLSAVASRYRWVCEAHKPDLSEPEWNALRDVLNGYWLLDDDGLGLAGISLSIIDGDRIDGLGQKWSINATALAAKVDAMDIATKVAMVEAIENWWSER